MGADLIIMMNTVHLMGNQFFVLLAKPHAEFFLFGDDERCNR
jgi:hypothetical protein